MKVLVKRTGFLPGIMVFIFLGLLFVLKDTKAWADQKAPLMQAHSLWQQKKWDDAVSAYEAYFKKNPKGIKAPEACMRIGQYLSSWGRLEEAIVYYQKGLKMAHGKTAEELKNRIADLHTRMGQFDEAIKIYQKLIKETKHWDIFKEANANLKSTLIYEASQRINRAGRSKPCGEESLRTVLKILKVTPQEKALKEVAGDRVSLESLKEAARKHGLEASGVYVKERNIKKISPPAILHFHPGHFVVLQTFTPKGVKILDPRRDRNLSRLVSYQDIKKVWTGYALCFKRKGLKAKGIMLLSKKKMAKVYGGHHPSGTRPSVTGAPPNGNAEMIDPPNILINSSNLNLMVKETDGVWKGMTSNVVLTRTYNSDDSNTGMFGHSWRFSYEVTLREDPSGDIYLTRGHGRVDKFTSRGDGTYAPPKAVFDQLTKNDDGTYTLLLKNTKERYNFDTSGRLSSIVDIKGNRIDISWGDHGITTITLHYVQFITKRIVFSYNENGLCNKITLPDGRFATFEYDDNGNLIKSTNVAGYVTEYTYDSNSYLTSISNSYGTTQITYQQDPANANLFVPQTVTWPLGGQIKLSIDTYNLVVTSTDSNGNTYTYYPSGSDGFTSRKIDPNGNEIRYDYDDRGNRISVTDPNGHTVRLNYDERGNLTSIQDPLGNSATFTYDSRDNLISATNFLGQTYTYTYDSRDNLIRITDPQGNQIDFTYDSYGRLTSLKDAKGSTTTFTYDFYGNLIFKTDAAGEVSHYTYNNAGWVTSYTDPNDNTINYTYDNLGRITRISYPDGTSIQYQYDCCNLLSVTDRNGQTMTFKYDADERLIQVTDEYGNTIQYGYDAVGNLVSLTYPDGKVVSYTYDGAGRLIKVTDWLNNVTTYTYDAAGNLVSTTLPTGTKITYQYDSANRLVSLSAGSSSSISYSYDYTLDALGNRISVSENAPLSPVFTPENVSYSYDSDNRLISAGGVTYLYDNNGNLIGAAGKGSISSYTYDEDNLLTRVSKDGTVVEYEYDAFGNRISKTVNGVTTRYVVDINRGISQVLAETDENGRITAYYVYGLGLISKITPSGKAYYYHYDGLGSTIAITDSSGNIVNKYAYSPYGEVLTQQETIANPFKYVGQFGVMDDGYGLLYMRARYYDPKLGRFITKDPIGFLGGLNLYKYAMNNPVNWIDPNGFAGNQGNFGNQILREAEKLKVKMIVGGIAGAIITGFLASYSPVVAVIVGVAFTISSAYDLYQFKVKEYKLAANEISGGALPYDPNMNITISFHKHTSRKQIVERGIVVYENTTSQIYSTIEYGI